MPNGTLGSAFFLARCGAGAAVPVGLSSVPVGLSWYIVRRFTKNPLPKGMCANLGRQLVGSP